MHRRNARKKPKKRCHESPGLSTAGKAKRDAEDVLELEEQTWLKANIVTLPVVTLEVATNDKRCSDHHVPKSPRIVK
ncbi:hypothetical protein VTJ04DRAFT_4357 [Mycothermus thermophilus]|uniref:uncharacterized protein n=1 Tax=Humicola insolens TaxID=85995 RepID=UPI003742E759